MVRTVATPSALSDPLEAGPAWDIARLFPNQGSWTQSDYLAISERTNRIVEMRDGNIEGQERPTRKHQRVLQFLYKASDALITPRQDGEVLVSPYPLKLGPSTFREPDVLYVSAKNLARMHNEFTETADLVIEVVSSNRKNDFVIKRQEYAEAKIPEYWIVDPEEKRIIVLKLEGSSYVEHGSWGPGQEATSVVLSDLRVGVDAVFA